MLNLIDGSLEETQLKGSQKEPRKTKTFPFAEQYLVSLVAIAAQFALECCLLVGIFVSILL